MLEVFTCLRSVGRRCYDGVKSWRERIHSRRAFSMVSVGQAALGQWHSTFAKSVGPMCDGTSRHTFVCHLNTSSLFVDHASSDGNSRRIPREL